MTQLRCLGCNYVTTAKEYKYKDCGLIELLMLRDIHIRTFGHKMEIVDNR